MLMNIRGRRKKIKLKFLFFSQYFWPENFRINELVKFFYKKNISSSVLTTFPSYPNKKIFENFKERVFVSKKIKLKRFRSFPRGQTNVSIFLNYSSFIINSLFSLSKFLTFNKTDVIFIFCPSPILSAIPAILINKIFNKKIVIWVLDLWPDTIVDLKIVKNKFLIFILKKLVNFIYNNTDLILAQSQELKKIIDKRTDTKCIFFPSWPEEDVKKVISKINIFEKKNKKFLYIVFTGNIGEAQSFDTLIKAVKFLKKKFNIKWFIVGEGRWKKKFSYLINKNKLNDQIKLFKSVDVSKISSILDYSDALYLSLKNNATFNKTIPGKLQTYMASGKPIIGSVSGEANKIINLSNCGFVSEAEDYKKLAKNIESFIRLNQIQRKMLGLNGKKYVLQNFNKKKIINNLIKNIINL